MSITVLIQNLNSIKDGKKSTRNRTRKSTGTFDLYFYYFLQCSGSHDVSSPVKNTSMSELLPYCPSNSD